MTRFLSLVAGVLLALGAGTAWAQDNAIESISANQLGGNVIIKVAMKEAPKALPIGFSITNPARIALDFNSTLNATGKTAQDINLGDVRGVNVVQAGPRTRLVLNLTRALSYAATIDGRAVIVTVEGSGGPAQAVNASGLPVAPAVAAPVPGAPAAMLRDLDFRRGSNGEGRIVVDLPNGQVPVDVRQVGAQIQVEFLKTGVPPALRRRLDVTDFGTPVSRITTTLQGENTRMVVDTQGNWEHSVYQSDTQLVIDVKPVKADPNRPAGGAGQGYRGEKVSFNFQNIEVRQALQAVADLSGLNIIASDSVGGSLTLHLKDVPWDQALDVILQAKGLDMRKNGNVLWIAPREELLTKEKLELEQKAQISDLEPLRSEVFQLNYQKAEAFRTVFGLDQAAGAGVGADTSASARNRVLSRRGSASIDPRTNQLFVTDIASKLDDIRKLIQRVDIPTKQVLVEARLVEASDSFSRNLGAKLGVSGVVSGSSVGQHVAVGGNITGVATTTGQIAATDTSFADTQLVNLPAAAINGNAAPTIAFSLFSSAANRFLNLELSALEADGKGKIISSPRLLTQDNVPAIIEQGVELPYQQATSSGATSVEFKKANLKLEVTPQITPDGNVVLDVDITKDSKGDSTTAGFAINTQHVKTKVMVDNGGTVVLGGIYQMSETSSDNKVPVLGDVPVLGNLFKSTSRDNSKTELLVFITPKVVNEEVQHGR